MLSVEETVSRLDALLDKEDLAGARALLYGSLEGYLAANDAPSAIGIYNELMGFERQHGENEAAAAAAAAALSLLEREGLADSRAAATVVLNAATVYHHAGREKDARRLYDRAEALFGRYYPAGCRKTEARLL